MYAESSILRALKPTLWIGTSKADLMAFPWEARRDAGFQLWKVQRGENPSDWKPLSRVGPGVREIRVREESGAFRVLYLANRPEGVYVLHCFQKKSQTTNEEDIRLAKKRLKTIPKPEKRGEAKEANE